MTALLTLAKSLGIDPGPLNQTELQEQTCSKAMDRIKELAIAVLEEIENRDRNEEAADMLANEIARFFGIDIGEHSSANSPWSNAFEAVPDTTLSALKVQWQAEYEHCDHKYARFGDQPHRRCIKCDRIERAQEAGDE